MNLTTSLLLAAAMFGPYNAEVVKIIDGDTVKMQLGLSPGLTKTINIRLDGVNTPEKRTRDQCEKTAGLAATAYTEQWLANAEKITVSNVRNGKYAGRWLGSIAADGRDLATDLIASGHGRPYHGEKRKPWCEQPPAANQ